MVRLKQVLILASLLFVALFFRGEMEGARAQDEHKLYFPLVIQAERVRVDTFDRTELGWTILNMKGAGDPSQTFFEIRNNRLYSKIKDNSDRWIIYPGWRPMGDFSLEVDARFLWPNDPSSPQTYSGLGMVWGGNDTWMEGYGYLLGFAGEQHSWGVSRFDGMSGGKPIVTNLTHWGGAPGFVKNWDNWNHMAISRIRDRIYVYCNGYPMPLPGPYYDFLSDNKYGTNRLVGLTVTSWEWSQDEIEFDNFTLTPLSMPY